MRVVAFILSLALALCLCGCTQTDSFHEPVVFYYCVNDIDYQNDPQIFGKEQHEGADYTGNLTGLLNEYLKGPKSDTLLNPFPAGSSVTSTKQEGNVLSIYLNEQFDRIPLEKLSIALACLVKTTLDYASAPVVLVFPHSTFIDGSTYRTYTEDSFLFSDANTAYSPPQ